jgi:hypothetical protein
MAVLILMNGCNIHHSNTGVVEDNCVDAFFSAVVVHSPAPQRRDIDQYACVGYYLKNVTCPVLVSYIPPTIITRPLATESRTMLLFLMIPRMVITTLLSATR